MYKSSFIPTISPIFLDLEYIKVYWYSIAYIVGILFALWYSNYIAKKYKLPLKETEINDSLLYIVLGVIIGGRLGYIVFYNPSYYLENPMEILSIYNAAEGFTGLKGMSFHGGMIGVILAGLLYSKKIKYPFFGTTDLMALSCPIGLFLVRIANFINGELYGRSTDVRWGVQFLEGGDILRHPSQLYEAMLEGILMFIILNSLKQKYLKRHGYISGMFLILYALFRIIVEFFREPDSHIGYYLAYFTWGQILCIPMIIVGAVCIIYSKRYSKNKF